MMNINNEGDTEAACEIVMIDPPPAFYEVKFCTVKLFA